MAEQNSNCVSCNGDGRFCGWCGLPAHSVCECSAAGTDYELCGDCGGLGLANVLEDEEPASEVSDD